MIKTFAVVIALLFSSVAYADDWVGNANFFLGGKALKKSDWAPLDRQGEFGALIDFGQRSWDGFNIAIDLLGSGDRGTVLGTDTEVRTSEFDVGVRKRFTVGDTPMHPFVGGGVAFIYGEVTGCASWSCVSSSDSGTGYWLDGGIYWTLGTNFNLGFEFRHSEATATIAGYNAEVGGDHAGLLLGFRW